MDTKNGKEFLESLINKTLRVTTRDTRMFVGQLRCTDKDRNLILSLTHEHRMPDLTAKPSTPKSLSVFQLPLKPSAQLDTSTSASAPISKDYGTEQVELRKEELETLAKLGAKVSPDGKKVTLNLQSRFLGLVVVPGVEIVKIEVEEKVT